MTEAAAAEAARGSPASADRINLAAVPLTAHKVIRTTTLIGLFRAGLAFLHNSVKATSSGGATQKRQPAIKAGAAAVPTHIILMTATLILYLSGRGIGVNVSYVRSPSLSFTA